MRTALTILGLALALSARAAPALAEPPPAAYPVDAELSECRRNLHLIYEALQAYRRVHHDLPNHLEELLPRFLANGQYLTCPAARRLGLSSLDVAKWGRDSQSTYGYEFGLEPIPKVISGGAARPMREWKRLQMGLIGSEVPIVRCQTHERAVLNLSFGGRLYESTNIDWEPLFEDKVQIWDFTHARCLTGYAVRKKIVVPRRDPRALPGLIDLSAYYTDLLTETWLETGSLRPLAGLSPGLLNVNGTSFDVRGLLQLGAARPGLVAYPVSVSNIVIGLPGRSVQLLLGTRHLVAPDTPVADLVFHLDNGLQRHFRVQYGRHLLACVSKAGELTTSLPHGKLAWKSEIGEGCHMHLYQCAWVNPFEQRVISRADFVAQPGESGPFLIALTVEPVQ